MTPLWNQGVEILKDAMIAYAWLFNGNLGAGILVVTFLARLALMPLTMRLSRMAAVHQKAMQRIQPELDRIKREYANDARRMNEETRRVFSREGISPVPLGSCLGTLAQAPILTGLYSAVRQVATAGGRFAWIRDISRPDWLLTVIVAAIGAVGAMFSDTPAQNRQLMMILPTVLTVIVLMKMSAGVALYWGMSNAFGAAQGYVGQRLRTSRGAQG